MTRYQKGKLEITEIYAATENGLDIITDIYPDALAAALAGGSFRADDTGQDAWLTRNGGVWYVQYREGEPESPVRLYMRHYGVGIDDALRQLHALYVANAAPVAEEGGER